MQAYEYFRDLAIILISAKLFGLLAKKLKAPQVVGQIIAGLLIGPSVLGWVQQSDFILVLAEVGVVLLMFSAGLETNLRDLIKTGPVAFTIACSGVLVPLVLGWLLYSLFFGFAPFGSDEFFRGVFIGTIMTATSVSITVQALRELGHLKGRVGTIIVSAAIIDDVIGIIVLTFVIGFRSSDAKPAEVVIKTLLFIVFSVVVGFLIYLLFKVLDKHAPHHRRIPIFGLVLCFAMAFCAEKFFGIADITGAYVAGIILCNLRDAEYIAGKMDISSYMLFGPVFFASIGLKTNFDGFSLQLLWFSLAFVAVALIAKVIGCGLMAKAWKMSWRDSLKVGVGMMTRGEVALIVSQKGLAVGMVSPEYFTSVILLILCSSVASPILLKLLYKGEKKPDHGHSGGENPDIDETEIVYSDY
ncbi:MAG TPA: sodium:proton antiporter [Ruminococcaceae bacterium]|nr:sodium:proton antiporter [Oscillospiraceae bacterium]